MHMAHPLVRVRGGAHKDANRILTFAPNPADQKWIESELSNLSLSTQVARSVREVVAALIEDPPPRSQILVADFDAIGPADVLHLHSVREGWFGAIIVLGNVDEALRISLNIDRVLQRPLRDGVLRKAISEVGLDRPTTRMPVLKP